MIRVLLFLRAWHAELRLWKHGLKRHLADPGALSDEQMDYMSKRVNQYWIDFSTGYVRIR